MESHFFLRIIHYFRYFGEILVLFFIFIFVNISAFGGNQFPDVTLFDGDGWQITSGSGLIIVFMLVFLYINGELKLFARIWMQNYPLILFLVISLLSLFWTGYLPATLYELMLLIFSVMAGSYIAVRFRLLGSITLITWVAGLCTVASLYIVFFTDFGIMPNEPFVGSWHGLFWHRNHTGNLMAFFNMVFLVRLLLEGGLSNKTRLIFIIFYFLTTLHVFGSRSATGVLIFIFLNLASFIFYLWVKWRRRLAPKHYYYFAAIIAVCFVVFITNLSFFFGLLGRTASMTGRTPLWRDLFLNFYLKKPLFGYGYGALWMQESFRLLMQARHGWKYPVYFADNGFFDLLLNLGIVGFVAFLVMFFKAVSQNVRRIRITYSWKYIFTLLVLFYVVIGNLTYSFLLEVDYFVWMWLIVVVFLLRMPEEEIS